LSNNVCISYKYWAKCRAFVDYCTQ